MNMGDKEDLEEMVNEPGTFSKVIEIPLQAVLGEGILREKNWCAEFALSFHLAQKKQASNFLGGGSSSYEKHSWKIGKTIGIIFNEKFTKKIKGNISQREIDKLFGLGKTIDYPHIQWNEKWNEVKKYIRKHEISLKQYHIEISIEEGKQYLGEYVYTLAALNDFVGVMSAWGVRAYFMDKKKIIRPFNRIYNTYMKAIVKPEYSRKEKALIKKFKNRIKFYKRDPKTGATELVN